ncbi:hypothetical protein, partial [Saccharothrix sp. ST-888]|uniref:hypothetical protein n=1 Tax=Saccharothrix sp. ST-888 TaxID=1427391 RepID=UPI0005EC4217
QQGEPEDAWADSLLAELDRPEARLGELTAADTEQGRIPARLQAMLNSLAETLAAGDAESIAGRLENASAHDIFAFIDNELGTA